MTTEKPGAIPVVLSVSGRDKGRKYVIVFKDEFFVYVSDGKYRLLDHAKKKNMKHVRTVGTITRDQAVWLADQPVRPIEVRNSELRKALAGFDSIKPEKGDKNG